MMTATERFDFYGLSVEVSGEREDLVREVKRHFAYFSSPGKGGEVQVEVHLAPPPYDELPSLPAAVFTPRNVSFRDNKVSYIDYFGRGLAIFDRAARRCDIFGTEHDLVHEIAYLFILSVVGQHLDAIGLHRVHALGVSYREKGILLLLPSGGGKSTMALELMQRPGFLLLGEDTPLIDAKAHVLPFPLRVGVRAERKVDIPPEYVRTVNRMEFDPKTLIDIDYFKARLGKTVDAGMILVGERNLGNVSEIVPLSRAKAFKAMLKYTIVGLGVYQGLEFLLERGLWDLTGQARSVASRIYNALVLIYRVPAYKFILGRNPRQNSQTFLDFVSSRYGHPLD